MRCLNAVGVSREVPTLSLLVNWDRYIILDVRNSIRIPISESKILKSDSLFLFLDYSKILICPSASTYGREMCLHKQWQAVKIATIAGTL